MRKFMAQSANYFNEVQIALIEENMGRRFMAKPVDIVIEKVDDGMPLEAFMRLPIQDAVSLMDALYKAGVRPSQVYPDDARIESIKYHLEDMRRLVFKELPDKGGE